MVTVGIRELKQRASELIRTARQDGTPLQITHHGEVVAFLIPVTPASPEAEAQAWAKVDQLAAEIQARWPEGVPAAEAVSEGRE